MSSPSGPPPYAPPAPPADKPSRRGCLIAVVVVLLLGMIGCAGACFYMAKNPGRILAASLGAMKGAAVSSIGADVPAEKRQAFEAEFQALQDWTSQLKPSEGMDPNAIQPPMQHLSTALQDKVISEEEIDTFITLSRKARGAD